MTEEKKKEEKKPNLWQKISQVQGEVGRVQKALTVQTGQGKGYKAVSESDILDAVNDAERKAGLVSYQSALEIVDQRTDEVLKNGYKTLQYYLRVKATVRVVDVDDPEKWVEFTGFGDGIDYGDKACGKAATYANKYALMKGYKIATGDDPDKEASKETQRVTGGASPGDIAELTQRLTAERKAKTLRFYHISTLAELTDTQAKQLLKKLDEEALRAAEEAEE